MAFPPKPRPTRSADAFARSESHTANTQFDLRNPSTLPPDAPTDDPLLDADEIGKRGANSKRNAVNIDGYESDSSNDGFDGRVAAKRQKRDGVGSKDDGGDDMFADDDDGGNGEEEIGGVPTAATKEKKKKKGVTFMEAGETVQGEVLASKSGGHVSADFSLSGGEDSKGRGGAKARNESAAPSAAKEMGQSRKGQAATTTTSSHHGNNHNNNDNDDDVGNEANSPSSSSSESSADDETRADIGDALDHELGAGSKKHHAPKLDAFNMRAEQEEGRFDSAGNYVRKAADPDAVHDQWLEGVSKRDMRRAREAMEQREAESRARQVEDDKVLTKDLLAALIRRLEVGETLLEALARLGKGAAGGRKRKMMAWGKRKRGGMDVDAGEEDDARELARREAVEAITGAADMLLSRGQEEIYDTERELLARQYQRETGEAWVDPPKAGVEAGVGEEENAASGAGGVWQYRWMHGRDGGKTYGDYNGPQMKVWMDAGFFGDDVEFRKVGEQEWSSSVRFV